MMHAVNRGITLIELTVVLAVVAIFVGIALPVYRSTVASTNINGAAEELKATLEWARSEAISKARNVTICRTTTGTACNAGTEWRTGWLVWRDDDEDSTMDNGEILKIRMTFDNGLTLTGPSAGLVFNIDGSSTDVKFPIGHTNSNAISNVCMSPLGKATRC
jgi:type IV fimbrial biogenesis protein FimT